MPVTEVSTTPLVGLSVMPETNYLSATLPLFEAGVVDVIEWSFDMSWRAGVPAWLAGLIEDYQAAGRLYGHGVSLSPLSTHPRQQRWFERFAKDAATHRFSHVSEHFGFMAAGDYRLGPPMPLPFTNETLRIGRDHLTRLQQIADSPVGLENLAFAFGTGDVWAQGDFLDALLEPVDGFLVLDVHNLWCQVVNFGLDPAELLATYPVDRVRECHISGGSWSETTHDGEHYRIRRDTHDGPVPTEVLDLLPLVLASCPNIEAIIVERIGSAFESPEDVDQFRQDYDQVRAVVQGPDEPKPAAALSRELSSPTAAHSDTATFPAEVMAILDHAPSADAAAAALRGLAPADPGWCAWTDQMQLPMVDTARELMATWARRNS